MTHLFKSDYQKFEGVRPITIYILRLFFALMFFIMGFTAWSNILRHKGDWLPMDGVVWCVWAAYATLSVIGLYNTLKILPILLFFDFL